MGAGRRRATVLVETLDERYKGALATKDTMEQKVQEGVRLMESMLSDFESRAYALRDSRLAAATEFMDETRRRVEGVVDEGIDKARRAKEALTQKIDYAIQQASKHGHITYHDLPDPWRVNPHILKGYAFHSTPMQCIRSAFFVSNEFVNIWSHVIGLIIILAIALYFYPHSSTFSGSTKADIAIAGLFLLAAAKCLVCSSLWHCMNSISDQPLMERFACVDYTGISLLVASSIMTTEYTAFYCEPVSRWTYIAFTFILGLLGTAMAWVPMFNRADMAWGRVAFFVTLALTGFLPAFQLMVTRGLAWCAVFYAPILKSVLVYFVGACLYAAQVPERFFPGCFDYIGGSHNIWHLAVLGGILFHYSAMQEFFQKAFVMASTGDCSVY